VKNGKKVAIIGGRIVGVTTLYSMGVEEQR